MACTVELTPAYVEHPVLAKSFELTTFALSAQFSYEDSYHSVPPPQRSANLVLDK